MLRKKEVFIEKSSGTEIKKVCAGRASTQIWTLYYSALAGMVKPGF
jgi:hypothetical protein